MGALKFGKSLQARAGCQVMKYEYERKPLKLFVENTGHKTLDSFYKAVTKEMEKKTTNLQYKPYHELKAPSEYGKTGKQIREERKRGEG